MLSRALPCKTPAWKQVKNARPSPLCYSKKLVDNMPIESFAVRNICTFENAEEQPFNMIVVSNSRTTTDGAFGSAFSSQQTAFVARQVGFCARRLWSLCNASQCLLNRMAPRGGRDNPQNAQPREKCYVVARCLCYLICHHFGAQRGFCEATSIRRKVERALQW